MSEVPVIHIRTRLRLLLRPLPLLPRWVVMMAVRQRVVVLVEPLQAGTLVVRQRVAVMETEMHAKAILIATQVAITNVKSMMSLAV